MHANDTNILLLDKPVGMSSYDVIRRLKRILSERKIGHAGTLDPLASGLLLIGIGEGTKRLRDFLKLPKTYEAEILLGERRDTGDREGSIVEEVEKVEVTEERVRAALAGMRGTLVLPVPAYSAIKWEGEPLYKKARRGEYVAPPIKPMEVQAADLLQLTEVSQRRAIVRVRFCVGSGTYIRTLAEELGRRLGYPATLHALRRTRIGDFVIDDAETITQVERRLSEEDSAFA